MSRQSLIRNLVASCLLSLLSLNTAALERQKLSSNIDTEAVTASISDALKQDYIFADVAAKISKLLERNQQSGKYDKYSDPQELSERLTQDIRSINNDTHLSVAYTPQNGGGMRMMMRGGPGSGANPAMLKRLARDNFGFKTIDILEGNIGYINLTSFVSPQHAGETAAAAMQYLQNTDAIIFDLRDNRGGAGEMYQLLASYFFDDGPLKLNEIYWPGEDRRYQVWTLPHLPGKRMPNKDIYILTSSITASAAEVFSYTLKHHKRATIVGEVTIGAANPISPSKVSKNFTVWMSKGEAKHPVTQSNWEGKGVIPHVKTTRQDALNKAHSMALEKLANSSVEDKSYFDWYHEIVDGKSNDLTPSNKQLQSYAGRYFSQSGEERIIQVKGGNLWYGPTPQELTKLTALSDTRFMIPGDNGFKLEIALEGEKVTGINRLFSTGRVIKMTK